MGALLSQFGSLANLVAASTTFRTVVGAANATAALTSIHYPQVDESATWPRAVITTGENYTSRKAGVGSWRRSGGLVLTLEFEVPADQVGVKAELLWFVTRVDAIIAEMETLAGTGIVGSASHLNAVEFAARVVAWPEDRAYTPPPDVGGIVPETSTLSRWWSEWGVTWGG